jgi:hypothetical protein
MTKNTTTTMSETSVYHVDLVSSSKFDEKVFQNFKTQIGDLNHDRDVIESFLDCIQINSQGYVEIYVEQGNTKITDPEDLYSLVKNVENVLGGFAGNSEFSWTVEFPFSHKTWQKNNFEWELVFDETDDYYEDESEYNDWEEEDSEW